MSKVFTPVVDAEEVYGEGDWRPILGTGPRKSDIKIYMIGKQSIEHRLRGVILPSFDFRLNLDDKAFMEAIGPFWTDQPDPHLPRHFVPNAWGLPIMIYPFLGERKEHWISPSNRKNMIGNDTIDPDETADAFDDLNKWVRRNKQFSQAKKDSLLKKDNMREDPPIPSRTVRYFSIAECSDKENDWHVAAIGYTATCHSYIVEQARWFHQDQEEPRDPNWPQYMLGDPTDPTQALVWHVDKVQLDPRDQQETNVICFTERREFLDQPQKTREVPQASLDKRFLLPDPDNWNIPTYEEQVEFMIKEFDPQVTADMIRQACSHRCRSEIPHERPQNVQLQSGSSPDDSEEGEPQQRSRTSRESQSEPEGDPVAAVTGGQSSGMAPKSAPPMPEDSSSASSQAESQAPTEEEPKYWAGPAGSTPEKFTPTELQAIVSAGRHGNFKVNMDGKKDWRSLADSGLVRLPQEDAPPSVPADEAPPVPVDEAPPVPEDTPANAPTESQAGGLTLEEMKLKLFPDQDAFAALPGDKKEKAENLVQRAWEATEQGTKRDLPNDVVSELMELVT